MLSDERFEKLLSEYFRERETYDSSHPHYEEAKLLLIAISEVEDVHNEVKTRHDDARHWLQQQLITRSIDDLLSAFLLTQNHFYSSAYRDVRGLFETFLVLNYLNGHKIEASRVYWKQERDLIEKSLDIESMKKLSWEELYSEDVFHDMLATERKRLEEQYSDFKRLYNFFSNNYVHPARLDGVNLQRTYVEEEEQQLIQWQLDLVLGLIYQLIVLYSDTDDLRYVADKIGPIGEEIEDTHSTQPFVDLAEDNFPTEED